MARIRPTFGPVGRWRPGTPVLYAALMMAVAAPAAYALAHPPWVPYLAALLVLGLPLATACLMTYRHGPLRAGNLTLAAGLGLLVGLADFSFGGANPGRESASWVLGGLIAALVAYATAAAGSAIGGILRRRRSPGDIAPKRPASRRPGALAVLLLVGLLAAEGTYLHARFYWSPPDQDGPFFEAVRGAILEFREDPPGLLCALTLLGAEEAGEGTLRIFAIERCDAFRLDSGTLRREDGDGHPVVYLVARRAGAYEVEAVEREWGTAPTEGEIASAFPPSTHEAILDEDRTRLPFRPDVWPEAGPLQERAREEWRRWCLSRSDEAGCASYLAKAWPVSGT